MYGIAPAPLLPAAEIPVDRRAYHGHYWHRVQYCWPKNFRISHNQAVRRLNREVRGVSEAPAHTLDRLPLHRDGAADFAWIVRDQRHLHVHPAVCDGGRSTAHHVSIA